MRGENGTAGFDNGDFVSRTEAEPTGARLEGFEPDFSGIGQIGQGLADELVRAGIHEHPTSRLLPVTATPAAVAMMAAIQP